MERTAERRIAACIAATLAGLGVLTALIVANHGSLPSTTESARTHPRGGTLIQPRGYATVPVTAHVARDATEKALTLLASDVADVAVDEAPPSAGVPVAGAPVAQRPVGRLESAAPGVVHTIQRAQALAAPVTAPLGETAPAPTPDPQPEADSGSPPPDCPLLSPVTEVLAIGPR
jgi:hypothetical protein